MDESLGKKPVDSRRPLDDLRDADADADADDFGVLVMAHGGLPEWGAGVMETVEPLRENNLEVALGMADAVSLQEAVTMLEERGARR